MSVKNDIDMPVGCAPCLLPCWNSERKFVCTATFLVLIGAFTLAIIESKQKYQEKMLAIQKCPCLEVQK